MEGYQTTSLKPSSLGSQAVLAPPIHEEKTQQYGSTGVTANSRGGTGSLTAKDRDGAEVAKIEWENGRMLTDGAQEIEVGADDSSST